MFVCVRVCARKRERERKDVKNRFFPLLILFLISLKLHCHQFQVNVINKDSQQESLMYHIKVG